MFVDEDAQRKPGVEIFPKRESRQASNTSISQQFECHSCHSNHHAHTASNSEPGIEDDLAISWKYDVLRVTRSTVMRGRWRFESGLSKI